MQTSRGKKTSRRSPSGEMLNDLVLQVLKVHAALVAVAPTVIRDERINSPKWQLMGAIRHEGKTAAQLGRELGMTRQITMWHAQALATEGIIIFDANPNHQRAHLITLTSEGTKVLEELTESQITWINALAKDFDPAHLTASVQTLGELYDRLR